MENPYKFQQSLLSLLLAAVLLLSAMPAFAADPVPLPLLTPQMQLEALADAVIAESVGGDPVFIDVTGTPNLQPGVLSMTEERRFVYAFPLDGVDAAAQAEAIEAGDYTLTLDRAKDADLAVYFPHQYLGGELEDWTVWNAENVTPVFDLQAALVHEEAGSGTDWALFLIENTYLLGSATSNSAGNTLLDYTGEYALSCAIDGVTAPQGGTPVRVTPYDTFRTAKEVNADIQAIADFIDKETSLYAEVIKLGTSTTVGEEIFCLLIADDDQTVTDYQAFKAEAEAGDLAGVDLDDIKVPILFSNIHSNESNGVDSILDFAWMLAKAAEAGAGNGEIEYDILTSFKEAGGQQLEAELKAKKIHWSQLLKDDPDDDTYWTEGLGFINGNTTEQSRGVVHSSSRPVNLNEYYETDTKTVEVANGSDGLLDKVFFLLVPSENQDGRTFHNRQNGNGFDLNRDNLFQTQQETRMMTEFISKWNPITYIELHGFVGNFQVEPCSPPHEPNFEYDLHAKNGLLAGEAFGIAAVANNTKYNSYGMPMRDYLTEDADGKPYWASPWDDMSTNYTPQYSMLHGTVAYTIEVPVADQQSCRALTYGLLGHAAYVAQNKGDFVANQLEFFDRGLNNVDVSVEANAQDLPDNKLAKWYVDVYDNPGAEAAAFRPKYPGNNNFFPEAYIIPLDAAEQRNPAAALEMGKFLLRNGVQLHELKDPLTYDGVTYPAGSLVVSMYQAKRNVANGALYNGVVISGWHDLYSEPITAFGHTRGFDFVAVDEVGKVTLAMLDEITSVAAPAPVLLTGTGDHVVLLNNSLDAVKAVNKLLDDGEVVSLITEGDYKGHFLITKALYDSDVAGSDFAVVCVPLKEAPASKALVKPTLYIPGAGATFATDRNGNPYGVKNYNDMRNTNRNFDLFAYGQQMGFTIVDTVAQANMIVGNRALSGAALAAVKAGTPYLGAGNNVLSVVKEDLLKGTGFDYGTTNGGHDALYQVDYVDNSPITDSYKYYDDNIQYSFGGAYIKTVPAKADVLIKATDSTFLEGFFAAADQKSFKNSIQAFEYRAKGLNLTIFAGTLTNKAHQQDDYRLAALAIFDAVAGSQEPTTGVGVPVPERPPTRPGFDGGSSGSGSTPPVAPTTPTEPVAPVVPPQEGEFEHSSYITGVSSGAFAPEQKLTRAESAALLSRLFPPVSADASGTFTDVSVSDWFYEALASLAAAGLINGYEDGSFQPGNPVTRAEFITLALRCLGVDPDGAAADFTDVPGDHWASQAIAKALQLGYVSGYEDGSFHPEDPISRAEAVTILNRIIGCSGHDDLGNPFTDVPEDHWAAGAIAAAATPHNH